MRGVERIARRVAYFPPKVGVAPGQNRRAGTGKGMCILLADWQLGLALDGHHGPAGDHRGHRGS